MFCCTPRKSTNPCQGRRRQRIIKDLCLNWGDAGGASFKASGPSFPCISPGAWSPPLTQNVLLHAPEEHQPLPPRGLELPANPECFAARPGRAPTPARGDAGSASSRTCVLTVLVPCNGGSHEGPRQARRWQCERMTATCPRRCRTTAIPKLLQTRQKKRGRTQCKNATSRL